MLDHVDKDIILGHVSIIDSHMISVLLDQTLVAFRILILAGEKQLLWFTGTSVITGKLGATMIVLDSPVTGGKAKETERSASIA